MFRNLWVGVLGGTIDLEQLEGAAAIGGITIPSPWDPLLDVKASAPAAVQRQAQAQAFVQARGQTEQDRLGAARKTVELVLGRIENQLPRFVEQVGMLP